MNGLAIYPGTFDPITNGHLDILQRAASLFSNIIIAVGENPEKQPFFSHKERFELVARVVTVLENPRISVDHFTGLLAQYAEEKGAEAIIRGLRAVSDFEHEFQMALANRKLFPNAETVFLMPSEPFVYLSSSMVKVIARNRGDISSFVPKEIINTMYKKLEVKNEC